MIYEDIEVEITLDSTLNKIKVTDPVTLEVQEHQVTVEDFNEIKAAMRVPGFGLGMLLIKIGRAFERAVGGGSSAE